MLYTTRAQDNIKFINTVCFRVYRYFPILTAVLILRWFNQGFPGGSVKNPPANAGDTGLISDPGRPHMLQGS